MDCVAAGWVVYWSVSWTWESWTDSCDNDFAPSIPSPSCNAGCVILVSSSVWLNTHTESRMFQADQKIKQVSQSNFYNSFLASLISELHHPLVGTRNKPQEIHTYRLHSRGWCVPWILLGMWVVHKENTFSVACTEQTSQAEDTHMQNLILRLNNWRVPPNQDQKGHLFQPAFSGDSCKWKCTWTTRRKWFGVILFFRSSVNLNDSSLRNLPVLNGYNHKYSRFQVYLYNLRNCNCKIGLKWYADLT